jgi:hypothetical protein
VERRRCPFSGAFVGERQTRKTLVCLTCTVEWADEELRCDYESAFFYLPPYDGERVG